jgi:hypothetical protein
MTATPHDSLSDTSTVSSDGNLRRVSPRTMILAMTAATELETKSFSIPSLLETIRRGRIRIPRFQRGFLWNDEDRRLLFDSIQRGYPIGTLLLARGHAGADSVNLGGFSAKVEETDDALWVVDGQQRLSTLAMALLEDHSGAYQPIFFDLDSERFVLGSRRGNRVSGHYGKAARARSGTVASSPETSSQPQSRSRNSAFPSRVMNRDGIRGW